MAAGTASCLEFGSDQSFQRAPEIKAKTWFNATSYRRLSLKALSGKVVMLFFWTINDSTCEQAAPFLNQWYARYRDKGLEIIGVHSTELEATYSEHALFEKIEKLGIKFPVVADNDSHIRYSFCLQLWPSIFLVDRKGLIRAKYDGILNFPDIETAFKVLLDEKPPERR